MSDGYSLSQFNSDMKQLGGMIESFYSQNDGKHKKGSGKKNKSFKQHGGEENEKVEKVKRYFKVLSVNGRPYPKYVRYSGAEPKNAAKKAARWICKRLNMNNNCKVTFQLKETTRGSDHRSYGPYKAYFQKLDKPKTFKFPGMKKPQTQTHDIIVKLAKK